MEPKLEYTVIKKNSLSELIDEVNRMIEEGWLPLGGISTKESINQDHFFQAMTRNPSQEAEKEP